MFKYIARQTTYHLLFTGAVYLVLRAPYFAWPSSIVYKLTAALSFYALYHDVQWKRPFPSNPAEQFILNFYIAAYGFVVSFFCGLMVEFDSPKPPSLIWLTFPVCYYFLLGLVTRIDRPDQKDVHERTSTEWQRQLVQALRQLQQQ